MRIVFVIGQLGTGGAETQLVGLSSALADCGHEVVVVSFFPGGANGEALLGKKSVHWVSLGNAKRKSKIARVWQLLQAPSRLRRQLSEIQPDIVYSMLHLSNLYAWLATRGGFQTALVWGYRASNMKLNWKRLLPERACAWLSPSVPLMIANSRAGADYALTKRGFRPQRLEVVVNGIDTEKFQPLPHHGQRVRAELGVKGGELLVGLVGRIDPMKGHDIFLRAARRILEKRGDCRFVIVGGGARKRIEDLKKLSYQLGVGGRVFWVGDREDMPAVYSALDILSSSSYGEGFPNVVGEAMACGTPCIVTKVGDSAMIVGSLGRVVPPGDSESLAQEIATFEEWSGKVMPEEIRERIVRNFSVEAMRDETERLLQYVNLLGKG